MKELATGRMDARRHSFSFKIEQTDNGSFVASVVHEGRKHADDDVGALYYVIAVIFIYGCSILMMIASYIRKNKTDRKLNRYLKEMANVRKRERQIQLLSATAKAATITNSEFKGSKLNIVNEVETTVETKTKRSSKLTFKIDTSGPQKLYSDKVYLDLPTCTYNYNSDSDNETSTEGEPMITTPVASRGRLSPHKSILKKSRSKSVTLVLPPDGGWPASITNTTPQLVSKSPLNEICMPVEHQVLSSVSSYEKSDTGDEMSGETKLNFDSANEYETGNAYGSIHSYSSDSSYNNQDKYNQKEISGAKGNTNADEEQTLQKTQSFPDDLQVVSTV